MSPSRKMIALRFKVLRLETGLTAATVAKELDIPRSTLTSIEHGRHLPNLIITRLLMANYNAPIDFLFTGRGLDRVLPEQLEDMIRETKTA